VRLSIRPISPADYDTLEALLAAAYGRPGEWRWELDHFVPLYPEGWFVATVNGALAGMGGATKFGPFAWIGLMAVDPAYQRQGIGASILERLLAYLEQVGCPITVLDASAAGAPLYERYQFQDNGTTVLYRAPDDAQPTGTPDSVHDIHLSDLHDLTAFDAPIFGVDRSAVLRTFIDAFPGRAFLTRDESGAVTGYLFGQTDRIGPWVASNPEDAKALLAAGVTLPYEQPPGVRSPSQNRSAADLLARHGFVEQRALRHMYRGPGPEQQDRSRIYSEASFGIG
jgi:GNAT superfamily N-acetyltransferase